jgi:excisionase family DNA binding protein
MASAGTQLQNNGGSQDFIEEDRSTTNDTKTSRSRIVTGQTEAAVAIRRPTRSPAPCLVDTIHGRANRLGVSAMTVRRRIKTGEIRAVRFGGAWRILAPERGSPSQLPEVCSVRQVANSLDVSELTVQRLIRSGRLNAFKASRRWWISRSVVVDLLAEPIKEMSNPGRTRTMCASSGHGSLHAVVSG